MSSQKAEFEGNGTHYDRGNVRSHPYTFGAQDLSVSSQKVGSKGNGIHYH